MLFALGTLLSCAASHDHRYFFLPLTLAPSSRVSLTLMYCSFISTDGILYIIIVQISRFGFSNAHEPTVPMKKDIAIHVHVGLYLTCVFVVKLKLENP